MRHIALITTSYPEGVAGAEAAGSFVEDFATELSRHVPYVRGARAFWAKQADMANR